MANYYDMKKTSIYHSNHDRVIWNESFFFCCCCCGCYSLFFFEKDNSMYDDRSSYYNVGVQFCLIYHSIKAQTSLCIRITLNHHLKWVNKFILGKMIASDSYNHIQCLSTSATLSLPSMNWVRKRKRNKKVKMLSSFMFSYTYNNPAYFNPYYEKKWIELRTKNCQILFFKKIKNNKNNGKNIKGIFFKIVNFLGWIIKAH